jgi:electron transport complex protein RnfG
MSTRRYIIASGLILGLFAVIGTALVGITHDTTEEKIAQNERQALLRKLQQILPAEQHDNNLLQSTLQIPADERLGHKRPSTVYIATRQDQISAMIFPVIAPRGYSGEIHMLVGIDIEGRIIGVRVVKHRETPGLGDAIEAERNDWILDFTGKSLNNPAPSKWKVKRDGGAFDQFTGATITPRAVVQAVQLCLVYFERHKDELISAYRKQQHEAAGAQQESTDTEHEHSEHE